MLFLLVLAVICGVILTERSLVGSVKSSGKRVYESARSDAQLRRERSEKRREEAQVRRQEALEKKEEALARRQEKEQRLREEEARRDAERILRMDRKASGITADTDLKKEAARRSREDIHEITLNDSGQEVTEVHNISPFGRPDQIAQPEGEPEEPDAVVFVGERRRLRSGPLQQHLVAGLDRHVVHLSVVMLHSMRAAARIDLKISGGGTDS